MLQEQVAEFKKAVRQARKFTGSLEQEWHFERCQVMRNRVSEAAINNRQAAITGMPIISKKDATNTMRTLLALRGVDKKGNIEAWEQGGLEVIPGSLKIQGAAQQWRGKVAQGEAWNIEGDDEEQERPRIDGEEGSCVKKGAIVAMVNERQLVPWSGGGNTLAKTALAA